MNLIAARCDGVNWFKVTSVCLLLANTELRYFCLEILKIVAVGGGFL